MINRFPMFTHC